MSGIGGSYMLLASRIVGMRKGIASGLDKAALRWLSFSQKAAFLDFQTRFQRIEKILKES